MPRVSSSSFHLPLIVYVPSTFPILISLNPIYFVYFSGDTIFDLATVFVTVNQLLLLEILFQDTTFSWFSSFICSHQLCVASTFSHKFINMWHFQCLSLFYKLVPLLTSLNLVVLNIVWMLTTFTPLLWTTALNTNTLYAKWMFLPDI